MKIAHVNDKVTITYINLDKRRSTYLSKTCLQKQAQKKNFHYTNMDYPKKKKKKGSYGFNFIWILDLRALSAALGRTSLSLDAPPTSKVYEAKACSKL